jgi:hypothetical protein
MKVAAQFAAQYAVGLLGLLFGLQAARVSRADTSSPAVHRLAWTVVAVGFVLAAASNLLQNGWGAWALAEGPQSGVWAAFVRWLPAGNYGRTVLKASLGVLLCLLPLLARLPRRRAVAVSAAVLLLTIPLGGAYGWREGPMQARVFFSAYSVFEVAEVLALFTALFIAVLWGTMDRWLWAAMAIYAFRQALNALSLAAMVFNGDPQRWSLSPLFVQIVGILSYSAMLWCAWRRWALAKRHQPVPSMVHEPRRPQASFLH